ncbi:MAG TPA: glycoside hydrolase family 16 protein [Stellaceae bacterium]|nr:glycoside hydrolase family 16 protein [Stellaceae bacterium]
MRGVSPRGIAAAALAAGVLASWFAAAVHAAEPPPERPQTLDLAGYRLTFDEDFDRLSVSAHGPGTRWIAHTPWNGDFGDAQFVDPQPGFPFSVDNGILHIEARKGSDGKWRSGLLSSRDRDGPDAHGFAQQYGYFEMRAKLPAGPGVWPAFWLVGTDKSHFSSEIDVMEQYGAFPNTYRATTHIWHDGKDDSKSQPIDTENGVMQSRFNTYGVSIEPDWLVFYFNRRAVWRTPTEPQFRMPFYILLDLGLGGGWPIDKTIDPSVMEVDYVKVYQH